MASTANEKKGPVGFEGVNPIFRVNDVIASREYYLTKLGFKVDFETPGFVAVSRDKCHLFLCEGDQGNPGAWVWVGVEDAQALWEEYTANRAKLRHPPTNYDWALEFQIEDLDGNVLRMGSEPLEGQPIGEWLDMRGHRWNLVDGRWEKAVE